MKPIIFLLCVCFLLSSCYSYKGVDLSRNKILTNKKYKIETKDTKIKAKIYKINDSTITIIKKGIKTEIALSNIKEIKKRKFSYLKTIGVTTSTILISTLIYVICCY